MNEKWLIGIIICTVIYVFLDFIKDGYKENAIQNGMDEKEARERYKWKNIFRNIKKGVPGSGKTGDSYDIGRKSGKRYIPI